ncbi:hypothetical protein GT755_04230 [Herbidospora sp. NEAU-GS84]|uniref:Uncharacterized protein n=1 Tax=Herbidospora solisilvae TaxID=2696284 RepID=A0A7C9NFB3_9ACTN|nr:hypothetical protein [Herbidospora solisilvae]NAS20892.1 hypothetical protein [Herbidospora solisilvae]
MTVSDQPVTTTESDFSAQLTGMRGDTSMIRDDISILRSGQGEIERAMRGIDLTVGLIRRDDMAVARGGISMIRDQISELKTGQTEIRELLADIVRRLDAGPDSADHV